MFTTSDILTQQLVEKRGFNHDARRTLRMSIMGTIIGPIQRTSMVSDIGALYTSNIQGTVCQEIDCRPNNIWPFYYIFLLHSFGNTGWKRIPGNKTVVAGEIRQDYIQSVQSLAVCAGCQLLFGSSSAQG